MSKLFCLACLTGAVILVVLAAALLRPEAAHDLGLPSCGWAVPVGGHRSHRPSDEELDKRVAAHRQRIAGKERVVAALLDKQITLVEAAAMFRQLNRQFPGESPFRNWPGDSEKERDCRQVIAWARAAADFQRPGSAAEVGARFEEELRRHKEQHGAVRLPQLAGVE